MTVIDDIERGPGGIGDADDTFLGPMVPRLALARSRNVRAVGVLEQWASTRSTPSSATLGLHEGKEPARRYGLGLGIGACR